MLKTLIRSNKLCFQLLQNVMWTDEIKHVINTSTGINGVTLTHHIAFVSTVTYLCYCIISKTVLGREYSGKVSKKLFDNFYF